MSDLRMRELERAAKTGDRSARLAWVLELVRLGHFQRFTRIGLRLLMDGDHLWEIRCWRVDYTVYGLLNPRLPICGVNLRRVRKDGNLCSLGSESSMRRNAWSAGGIDVVGFLANYWDGRHEPPRRLADRATKGAS